MKRAEALGLAALKRSPKIVGKKSQTKKPLILRLYDWPLCYFTGIIIGLVVTILIGFFDQNIGSFLNPVGRLLFLGGWAVVIGGSFGSGMERFIEVAEPTQVQRRIQRFSIILGMAISVTGAVFFSR